MAALLVILRFIHIAGAFVWVGMALTMFFFVSPAVRKAGPAGPAFMRSLVGATSYSTVIAAASGITVAAGILLYLVSGSANHFSRTGNIVLGIGAVAGLIAFVHGAFYLGAITRRMKAIMLALPADGPPPADQAGQLQSLGAQLARHMPYSMALMAVAVLGMGLARYLA